MIPMSTETSPTKISKPRASGDDPDFADAHSESKR